MAISIVIVVISFLLDIILSNFLPYMVGGLSFFTPMLTIVSLFLIYPFFKKDEKKYFLIACILGIIYDLFLTNLLFFNGILFFVIAYLVTILYKYLEVNYINILLDIILVIVCYEVATAFVILLFNLVPISFYKLFYKISHSLILNIIYAEVIYFVIKALPKKYTKLSIN